MIFPLLLHNDDAQLRGGSDDAVDDEVFLVEVSDIIPACVANIREF